MKEYSISAIVVTYNRKQLLQRCVEAIALQSYKPKDVFIVDNASTDGTSDMVSELAINNQLSYGIQWHYLHLDSNVGGAGGFYCGMKTAIDTVCPDALWVMDDDGQPEENCLKSLVSYLGSNDYIAPIVLSDDDHEKCSFAPQHESLDVFSEMMHSHGGIIDNWASPFNGILFSSRLVESVGLPKREMFIWGDEVNYHYRAIQAGFVPITVLSARHYHPLNRQYDIPFKWGTVLDIPQDWKLYCMLRNKFYNNIVLNKNKVRYCLRNIKLSLLYLLYFREKGENGRMRIVLSAFADAMTKNFDGLNRYF